MKPDTYKLIEMCVEIGVTRGLHRAFKHSDESLIDGVTEKVSQAVMHEICEWFKFDPIKDTGEE